MTVGIVMAALAGCCDARFQNASQQRLDRIDQLFTAIDQREKDCPRRLAHVAAVAEKARLYQANRLQIDVAQLQKWQKREIVRWPARREETRRFLDARMKGHPENIPDTFAHLFY